MIKRPRLHLTAALSVAGLLLAAAPASAQIYRVTRDEPRNAVSFNIGYFALRGLDSRDADDVLIADLDDLTFDIKDFNGVTFGGEYLFGLGDFLEGGVGVGYYEKTTPSVYRDFVNENGTEIEQELKLRVVPIEATVRFLPVGHAAVQPYVGAGIGFYNFRYSEIGEFVDFSDGAIFSDRYIDTGTAVGPIVLGGVRFPVGDAVQIGGELRYRWAIGDINEDGFLSDKLDLGGLTSSFTIGFRF
jgi:opacity protein-like surface antigen